MSDKNEEKKIYGDGDWSARAWRREPDHPKWSVSVKYGDGGWECEPGVYGENIDMAIDQVGQALSELESLYTALRKFRVSQPSDRI